MKLRFHHVACAMILAGTAFAQQTPDLIYYRFNEGTGTVTANMAAPGVGVTPAPIVGLTLVAAPAGQFSDGALGGAAGASYVNTGWPLGFGTGAWTISFWLQTGPSLAAALINNLFGDPTNTGFRCYSTAALSTGPVTLTGGGVTTVTIPGGASAAGRVCTFVYDPTVPDIRGYLDGVLVATVLQPPLNITGTANFRVGGQTNGMSIGTRLDEFRVYGRALTAAEVAATWNVSVVGPNAALSSVGPGCAGTGGLVPALGSPQLPTLGNAAFALNLTQAAANAPAYLYLSVGISPGYAISPTCVTYLEPTSLFAFIAVGFVPFGPVQTSAGGSAAFPLPVPADPALAGTLVGLQAAVLDAGNPSGFTVSNGLGALIN